MAIDSDMTTKPPPFLTPDELREDIAQNGLTMKYGLTYGLHRQMYPPKPGKMTETYRKYIDKNGGKPGIASEWIDDAWWEPYNGGNPYADPVNIVEEISELNDDEKLEALAEG